MTKDALDKRIDRLPPELLEKIKTAKWSKWQTLKVLAKTGVLVVPCVYLLCSFMAWDINPTDWGTFVRTFGTLLILGFEVAALLFFYGLFVLIKERLS